MAKPFRAQVIGGGGILLVFFLAAVFVGGRATFQEQLRLLQREASFISASVMSTAEAGHLDGQAMLRAMQALPVPQDGVVAMIDIATGTIVASRGPDDVIAHIKGGAWADTSVHDDLDGVPRSYGSALSADGRTRMMIGLPRRLAWDNVIPIYRRNAVGASGWYFLTAALLYWQLSRWIKSVRHLERIAATVSSGDLRTPESRPMQTSEMEQMQRSMIEMVVRVRELQSQVVRQERLVAIGTLVSGVAHEISNPLQSILGSAQVIQARDDLPADVRADLGVIQSESQRADAIIRNLTRFTRQQTSGPVDVKLTDIVRWLTELWKRRLVEQGITLDVDDQSVRTALAVSNEIQQVALNFLANAEYAVRDAGQGERRVVVRTRDTANGCVRLEVEDSGPGVKPEDVEKLFLPFFTTKPVGEGTGLGLSVSYGIIHSLGGTIGYDRGATGGARFFFEIPAR